MALIRKTRRDRHLGPKLQATLQRIADEARYEVLDFLMTLSFWLIFRGQGGKRWSGWSCRLRIRCDTRLMTPSFAIYVLVILSTEFNVLRKFWIKLVKLFYFPDKLGPQDKKTARCVDVYWTYVDLHGSSKKGEHSMAIYMAWCRYEALLRGSVKT